jgi:hypothetical protein
MQKWVLDDGVVGALANFVTVIFEMKAIGNIK